MTPSRTCTLRVTIDGKTYPAAFVILPKCSRDVILGMYFLTDNGAIIDQQTKSITFSCDHSITPEPNPGHHAALRITDDHVTLPPRASLMVTVYCEDVVPDVDAIVESDRRLLLDRGVSVAGGIARFMQRQYQISVTNFSDAYQHLNREAAIAFLEVTQEASNVIAVAHFERAPEDTCKLSNPFDVNPVLPQQQQKKLLDLLHHYRECFSSNSKLSQTPLAKHQIKTEDGARPTRLSPYRVSSHELEAIRTQVDDMLSDDSIQP